MNFDCENERNMDKHNLIPAYMMESIHYYVTHGTPLGGFLSAVFSNDLFKAVAQADNRNLGLLPTYVSYIFNELPAGCHGSKENVHNWVLSKQKELEE